MIRTAYDRAIFLEHETRERSSHLRGHACRLPNLGQRTVKVTDSRIVKRPKRTGKKKVQYR